jgi:hypothetical protein
MFDSLPNGGHSPLAKLAALFAAAFIVSFGICGYSTSHGQDEFGGTPGFLSFIGMAISFISLLAIGLTALFRIIRER